MGQLKMCNMLNGNKRYTSWEKGQFSVFTDNMIISTDNT